jgi:PAS domain S-box-containing protein
LNLIPGFFYLYDNDGNLIRWNQNTEILSGYTPDELKKMKILDWYSKSDQEIVQEKINEVFSKGNSEITDIQLVNKEGKKVPFHLVGTKIILDGKPHLLGIGLDLSELKKTQEALFESNANLNAQIQTSKDWIWAIDKEGIHIFSNPAIEQILGYHPNEIIGIQSLKLIHDEDRKIVEKSLPHWIEEKQGWSNLLLRWKHKNGTYKYLESNAVPILDSNNNFIGFRGIDRDITDRIMNDRALIQSEEKFSKIFHTGQDAIALTRLDEIKIIDVNESFLELLGYTREEVIGKTSIELGVLVNVSDREKMNSILMSDGSLTNFEADFRTKSGKIGIGQFSTNFLTIGNDKCLLTIIKDITTQKKAEKDLKNALIEVEELRRQLEVENVYLREEIKLQHDFGNIITQNNKYKKVLRKIEQVAETDTTVLILGETGTGKELLARAVHSLSNRANKPFVKINCASLPVNLIESELFGHEKGAFTGAFKRHVGRFELADKGTLFLDEIGELPMEVQAKFLRILQEGEFERIGSTETLKVNVRIITATNRNLLNLIEHGKFREDLYYRLNVFPLHSIPLRDRKEDIPLLLNHFVNVFSAKSGKRIEEIPKHVLNVLTNYSWPGNVRELENVVERAVIISSDKVLRIEELVEKSDAIKTSIPKEPNTLKEMEIKLINRVLENCNWKIEGEKGAAKILGIPPSTLRDKITKYKLKKS